MQMAICLQKENSDIISDKKLSALSGQLSQLTCQLLGFLDLNVIRTV